MSTGIATIPATSETFVQDNPELFHYTTFDGLAGIVRSRSIWATHFAFLNDRSELSMLRLQVAAPVAEKIGCMLKDDVRPDIQTLIGKAGSLQIAARNVTANILDIMHHALLATNESSDASARLAMIFVASFCAHAEDDAYVRSNGLLSQWRGYGKNGGCCIVFQTVPLVEMLSRESHRHFYSYLNISNVVYTDQDGAMQPIINTISAAAARLGGMALELRKYEDQSALYLSYLSHASLIKHRGFKEEREVRIVASPISQFAIDIAIEPVRHAFSNMKLQRPNMEFKTMRRSGSRPYIALFEHLDQNLPIDRVILGPSADPEQNYARARAVLGPAIRIVQSETPFAG